MEPKHNNEYLSGTELPPVQEGTGHHYNNENSVAAPETRGTPSTVGGPSPAAALPAALPVTPQTDGSSATPTNLTPAATAALAADDADLIEKEWVLKAKAIVMQTKNDPHQQNVQMNGIKADYIKKRYNKDLKISGA